MAIGPSPVRDLILQGLLNSQRSSAAIQGSIMKALVDEALTRTSPLEIAQTRGATLTGDLRQEQTITERALREPRVGAETELGGTRQAQRRLREQELAEVPETSEESFARIEGESAARARGTASVRPPATPPAGSVLERALGRRVESGAMTPQARDEILIEVGTRFGVPRETPPEAAAKTTARAIAASQAPLTKKQFRDEKTRIIDEILDTGIGVPTGRRIEGRDVVDFLTPPEVRAFIGKLEKLPPEVLSPPRPRPTTGIPLNLSKKELLLWNNPEIMSILRGLVALNPSTAKRAAPPAAAPAGTNGGTPALRRPPNGAPAVGGAGLSREEILAELKARGVPIQ